MPRALLALDLDGTLLRTDGRIDPRDASAIDRAIDAGVAVTLATGRVSTGTMPTARALGLVHPLVCADGGLLVDAATGERLEQTAIALATASEVIEAFDRHALAGFVLLHDEIHCDERGRCHTEYVRTWTTRVTVHPHLGRAKAWRRDGDIALTVGIGAQADVLIVHEQLRTTHADRIDVVSFKINRAGDHWAVMTRPSGCTKATGLERVARRLGVAHEDTAVVGDWLNDVPMFHWAMRSFAMGQAPAPVRAAASDILTATSSTGGGVAEALARWRAL